MRGGKRILAIGSYTKTDDGPGILFEYDEREEVLHVKFANGEHLWSVQLSLRMHRWTHVFAQWIYSKGLRVVLDGAVGDVDSERKDEKGVVKKVPLTP